MHNFWTVKCFDAFCLVLCTAEPFVDVAAVFSNLSTVHSLSRNVLKKKTNTCRAP